MQFAIFPSLPNASLEHQKAKKDFSAKESFYSGMTGLGPSSDPLQSIQSWKDAVCFEVSG